MTDFLQTLHTFWIWRCHGLYTFCRNLDCGSRLMGHYCQIYGNFSYIALELKKPMTDFFQTLHTFWIWQCHSLYTFDKIYIFRSRVMGLYWSNLRQFLFCCTFTKGGPCLIFFKLCIHILYDDVTVCICFDDIIVI